MFKRIKSMFTTDALKGEKLDKYGYVPSHEEMQNPGVGWDKIQEHKRKYQFEGNF